MSQPHCSKRSLQTRYFDALTNLTPLTIPQTIHILGGTLRFHSRFESEYPETYSTTKAPISPAIQISTFYTTIGLLRSYIGEYWLAKYSFLKALLYDPFSILAHYCMGICLFELGDYMHAERKFGRCLGAIGEEEDVDLSLGCWDEDGEGNSKGKWRLKKLDVAWNMLASHNTFNIQTHLRPEERRWGIIGVPATLIFSNSPLTEEELQRLLPVSRTKPLPPLPPPTPFAKTPIEEGITDNGKEGSWSSSSHAPSSPPRVLTRAISPSFTEIRAGPPYSIDPKLEEGKIQEEKETNEGTTYEDGEDEESPPSSLQPNQNSVYSDPLRGTQPPQEEPEEYDSYYDLEIPDLLHSRPASPSGSFSSLISLYTHSPSSNPIPSSTFTQTPPSTNPLPSSTFTQTPPTTTSINRDPDFPTSTAEEEETSTPTQVSKGDSKPGKRGTKPALTIPFPSTSSTTISSDAPAPLPTAFPPTREKPTLTLSTAAAAPFRPAPAYKLMAKDMAFLPLTRTYREIKSQAKDAKRAVKASMRGLGISGVPVDPALSEGKRDGKGLGDDGAEILLPRTFEGFGPGRKRRGGQ